MIGQPELSAHPSFQKGLRRADIKAFLYAASEGTYEDGVDALEEPNTLTEEQFFYLVGAATVLTKKGIEHFLEQLEE